MSTQPLVITLLGPTASGKTDLALELAERLGLPVINVDSRQLYREMDVGTAKSNIGQNFRRQGQVTVFRMSSGCTRNKYIHMQKGASCLI